MYTYVQSGCKKVNTATYIHTGGVSNAYSRIRMTRARVHGWVGTEKLRRRVHREPTGLDGTTDRNEAWRTAERRKRPCVRPGHGRNGILFIRRGLAYRKTEETDFSWTSYGRNGVLLIERGVAYHKTEETDLCWSATVETEVLFIRRGVAYCKTGLHGLLFISTVDLLQPPRATVHPPSTSSSLHLRLFMHGLLFIQPPPLLHRLLFSQPSPW